MEKRILIFLLALFCFIGCESEDNAPKKVYVDGIEVIPNIDVNNIPILTKDNYRQILVSLPENTPDTPYNVVFDISFSDFGSAFNVFGDNPYKDCNAYLNVAFLEGAIIEGNKIINSPNIISIDFKNVNVISFIGTGIFKNCKNLREVKNLNCRKSFDDYNLVLIVGMKEAFSGCENLETVDISNMTFTDNEGKPPINMFKDCKNLKNVSISFSPACAGYYKICEYNFSGMFENCSSLEVVDLSDCFQDL